MNVLVACEEFQAVCKAFREAVSAAGDLLVKQGAQIADLQNELQKMKEQNRWIPVTERLPAQFEKVLVAINSTLSKETYIAVGSMYYNVFNRPSWLEHFITLYEPTTNIISDSWHFKVTHWMQLPELPTITLGGD